MEGDAVPDDVLPSGEGIYCLQLVPDDVLPGIEGIYCLQLEDPGEAKGKSSSILACYTCGVLFNTLSLYNACHRNFEKPDAAECLMRHSLRITRLVLSYGLKLVDLEQNRL